MESNFAFRASAHKHHPPLWCYVAGIHDCTWTLWIQIRVFVISLRLIAWFLPSLSHPGRSKSPDKHRSILPLECALRQADVGFTSMWNNLRMVRVYSQGLLMLFTHLSCATSVEYIHTHGHQSNWVGSIPRKVMCTLVPWERSNYSWKHCYGSLYCGAFLLLTAPVHLNFDHCYGHASHKSALNHLTEVLSNNDRQDCPKVRCI